MPSRPLGLIREREYNNYRRALGVETNRLARNRSWKRAGLVAGGSLLAAGLMRLRSGKRYRYNNGSSSSYLRRVRMRMTPMKRTKKYASSGQGITTQHDARRIYRKRRMPRRMRKRWRRFSRRVYAVSEKDLGSRTVVFNKSQQFQNQTSGDHGIAYCALYSANGVGDSFMSDLANLSGYENTGNPTAAAGGTVQDTTKFLFKSAVLDITVRNTSGENSSGEVLATSLAILEVDVYEIVSRRVWSTTTNTYSDVTSAIAASAGQTLNIGGAGTGITLNSRGATPWDIPMALSFWKMKILKKQKYFLANQSTFTYQIRDPKRRVMTQEEMEKYEGGNAPYWSRHILIIYKLVPGLAVSANTGDYTERIQVGITRKYFYKIEGQNEDRDRYLANT